MIISLEKCPPLSSEICYRDHLAVINNSRSISIFFLLISFQAIIAFDGKALAQPAEPLVLSHRGWVIVIDPSKVIAQPLRSVNEIEQSLYAPLDEAYKQANKAARMANQVNSSAGEGVTPASLAAPVGAAANQMHNTAEAMRIASNRLLEASRDLQRLADWGDGQIRALTAVNYAATSLVAFYGPAKYAAVLALWGLKGGDYSLEYLTALVSKARQLGLALENSARSWHILANAWDAKRDIWNNGSKLLANSDLPSTLSGSMSLSTDFVVALGAGVAGSAIVVPLVAADRAPPFQFIGTPPTAISQ